MTSVIEAISRSHAVRIPLTAGLGRADHDQKKWLLEFSYPALDRMKVTDIKPVHALRVLQDIEEI
ncbi:MAG TPA: hypothetical protein V6C72_15450 [Chroococcales cyanobacterium]